MATFSGPQITDNSLVFALDAGNTKSYPGSGSTWFDIGGGGNGNATLGAGVTYSSSNGGILVFNGNAANGQAVVPLSAFDFRSTNHTIVAASRYTGGTNGRIITSSLGGGGNNWLMGHWGGQVNKYHADGWVSNVGGDSADTSWFIWAATGNIGTDTWELYRNGSVIYSNNGGTAGPYGLTVGGSSEPSNAQVGFVFAYNRVLTSTEISQIYYIYRNRYGI
jgi:hypothetical protein